MAAVRYLMMQKAVEKMPGRRQGVEVRSLEIPARRQRPRLVRSEDLLGVGRENFGVKFHRSVAIPEQHGNKMMPAVFQGLAGPVAELHQGIVRVGGLIDPDYEVEIPHAARERPAFGGCEVVG